MNTQKSINKVVWAVTAGIMVSTIVLYATTERSREQQYGEQTQQQREQKQYGEQSQQQQMHSQGRQMSTQAGALCRLDDLLGSDVKSDMQQGSKALSKRSERQESESGWDGQRRMDKQRDEDKQRDKDGQSGIFGWSNDEQDSQTTLGTVEELILDDQKNEIRYVVLQSDNQNYLIPWQAFNVKSADVRGGAQSGRYSDATRQGTSDRSGAERGRYSDATRPQTQQGPGAIGQRQDPAGSSRMSRRGSADSSKPTLYLNLSKDQLQQAPTIDSISVDAVSDSQLKQRIDSFYAEHIQSHASQFKGSAAGQFSQQQSSQQAGRQQQQTTRRDQQTGTDRLQGGVFDQQSMASGRLFKVTDLVGMDLKSIQDDSDLGTIEDMVMDTREGQIAYGLVSFGGFLGMGQKMGVVPWSSVTIDADLDYARINATKDQLSAAVLEDDSIDKLSEAQFANKIHNSFNAEPYWQVYGYMPADDDTSDSMNDNDWQRRQKQQTEQQQQRDQQRNRDQQQNQQQR